MKRNDWWVLWVSGLLMVCGLMCLVLASVDHHEQQTHPALSFVEQVHKLPSYRLVDGSTIIELGHLVCQGAQQGWSMSEQVATFSDSGADPVDAAAMIDAATQTYCPDLNYSP